ncbi:hypothetical protein GCM10011357_15700 [Lacimicrobium alkaliphilum]|uniref:Peptidase M56 domain-containing protein n=1 Tax=Lacimicrobium alkaliphilum TaxID=1526571 RepID=A0ABQ1RBN4_9ALTE|nr:hypothetical protein GCM10011357_15700 [Lacimicrobium alkaliphilum]
MYRHSSPTNKYSDLSEGYPVRITSLGTPAIASGLLRPVIWLDHSMETRSELASILRHEANHLRLGDIYWAWFLCLFESFFWWNPLCKMLTKQAKEQLELRCDERCFATLNQQYQQDLASLLLVQHSNNQQQSFTAPLLSIAHKSNFNIKRIKTLDKEKTMKTKHVVALILSISCSAATAAKIVGSESAEQPVTQQQVDSNYDAQLADLLARSSNAKSTDAELLNEVFTNILDWQSGRERLNSHEEVKIQLLGFTLLSHVGHKLGRYKDVLSAYEQWYPQTDRAPFFLKNLSAITHLRLGQPEAALEDMLALKAILKDRTKEGSLLLLARAYVEMKDYDNAQTVLAQLSDSNVMGNALKYYVSFHQNDTAEMELVKTKLPAEFDTLPPTLPDLGIPLSPLLEKL